MQAPLSVHVEAHKEDQGRAELEGEVQSLPPTIPAATNRSWRPAEELPRGRAIALIEDDALQVGANPASLGRLRDLEAREGAAVVERPPFVVSRIENVSPLRDK